MFKKSQGISINTIIIAALALAVLVVLFIIFTGRFKIFSEGVKESSLTCDSGCRSVGYSGGSPRPVSCGIDTQIPGRFEGMLQNDVCCCFPK